MRASLEERAERLKTQAEKARAALSCGHNNYSDLTQGIGESSPHLFCHVCKSHWYKGREWMREEWDKYVNEVTP